jgi:hypothetical protein
MWRVPSLQVVATEIVPSSGPMAVTGTKFAQTPILLSTDPAGSAVVAQRPGCRCPRQHCPLCRTSTSPSPQTARRSRSSSTGTGALASSGCGPSTTTRPGSVTSPTASPVSSQARSGRSLRMRSERTPWIGLVVEFSSQTLRLLDHLDLQLMILVDRLVSRLGDRQGNRRGMPARRTPLPGCRQPI